MKRPSNTLIARLSLLFSALVLLSLILAWKDVQFDRYHGRNIVLSPADFNFDLATKEDYAKLLDTAVREFKYADGRYIVKAPAYDDSGLPNFYTPSYDGRYYLQVTLKGTAPFVDYWIDGMIQLMMNAVAAFVFTIWSYRNLMRASSPTAAPSEPNQAPSVPLPPAQMPVKF